MTEGKLSNVSHYELIIQQILDSFGQLISKHTVDVKGLHTPVKKINDGRSFPHF